MFSLSKRFTQRILGIDIASDAIRIVELSHYKNAYQITNFGWVPNSAPFLETESIQDCNALAAQLKIFVQNLAFSTKKAVVAIPDKRVTRKVIQLSAAFSKIEIEAFVLMELDQLFSGIPPSELAFDFIPLGFSSGQKLLQDILIVGVLKKEVDERVLLLKEAGLIPYCITLKSEAVKNLLNLLIKHNPMLKEQSMQGFLELEREGFYLSIFKKQEIIYFHEQKVESQEPKIIIDVFLACLTHFSSTTPFPQLQHLWLAGTRPDLELFSKSLSLIIQGKVHIVNPFSLLSLELALYQRQTDIPSQYYLSLGLGLML